jgi:hypothetical protein
LELLKRMGGELGCWQKQASPTLKAAHLLNRSQGLGCATLSKLRNKTGNAKSKLHGKQRRSAFSIAGFVS